MSSVWTSTIIVAIGYVYTIIAFKPRSMANGRKTQPDFRHQLIKQLFNQMPPNQLLRRYRGPSSASNTMDKDRHSHSFGHSTECVLLSEKYLKFVLSSQICHTLQMHLGNGTCFALYHSSHSITTYIRHITSNLYSIARST